jgi:hypothetical protein
MPDTDAVDVSKAPDAVETPTVPVATEPAKEGDKSSESAPPADSTKDGDKPVLSLKDVVRDAARPPKAKDKAADSPAADGKVTDSTQVNADKTAVVKTAADKADELPPFHEHPRWKQVIGEKRKLETRVSELTPDAEDHRKVIAFIDKAGLSVEEVGRGFQIMALLKHDPAKAAELMQPWLEHIDTATGKKLPVDLQKRLDDGVIDRESAAELARTRADMARSQETVQRTTQEVDAQRVQQQQQELASGIHSTVASWEAEIAKNDPDFPAKQAFVLDRVKAMIAETPPRSPQDALVMAKKAYEEVTTRLRPVARDTRQMRTRTSSESTGRTEAKAPTSMREVIKTALRAGQV